MSFDDFFNEVSASQESSNTNWGTAVERERKLRIKLCVAAYVYEFHNDSIMSDAEYDKLSLEVDVDVSTGNAEMDAFFKEHFHPDTGQWIHHHPDHSGLYTIYRKYFCNTKSF